MRILAFDIETVASPGRPHWEALEPWRRPLVSLTGAAISPTEYVQTWWPDMAARPHAQWLASLAADDVVIVGWNLIYDWSVLIAHEGDAVRDALLRLGQAGRLLDLMYLAKRVDGMYSARTRLGGYSLAAWLERYGIRHDAKGGTDYVVSPGDRPEDLAAYHARDLTATWEVAQALIRDATSDDLYGALLESSIDPVWADSYVRGIRVDVDRLRALTAETEKAAQTAFARIAEVWPDVTPQALRSVVQLRDRLFVGGDLDPVRQTKSGQAGVDSRSLTLLGGESEIAQRIAAYKKVQTRLDRFLVKTADALRYCGSGRVHPQPRPASTYTGRATYSTVVKVRTTRADGRTFTVRETTSPPIQQIERSADVRAIFVPDDGWLWAEYDFAAQEMRLLADRSGDAAMIAAFRAGADLHSMTAARLFGRDYDELVERVHAGDKMAKAQRMAGKVTNLAAQYRIGPKTFAFNAATVHNLHLTEEEAQSYLLEYRRQWPGVPAYWDSAIARARVDGYARTVGGRRIRLDFPIDPKLRYADDQAAINAPIQGSGADLKVVAMAATVPFILSGRARLILELHDGLHLAVRDAETAAELLRALNAINWKQILNWQPTVPMTIEGKVGPSWGFLKEIRE